MQIEDGLVRDGQLAAADKRVSTPTPLPGDLKSRILQLLPSGGQVAPLLGWARKESPERLTFGMDVSPALIEGLAKGAMSLFMGVRTGSP